MTEITKQDKDQINRRRTFAIISHPDAGKTTLTEKLLLFGGAIQLAGAVRARKADRHATSDWMAIEKARGISVTTSVMRFVYRDHEFNLLDTPGHQDFSEDTYRVLTAVDSALMVIDSAKGVEPQTEKLMAVCRMRNCPVITFINKMDRQGMSPLDLLSDIENKLQIECVPMSWPIGQGQDFKGVFNLQSKTIQLFSPGANTRGQGAILLDGLNDSRLDDLLPGHAQRLREDVELLDGAASPFEHAHYLKGSQTPVFFGSGINNFGVKELLDEFVNLAPAPGPRQTVSRQVSPSEPQFSGFVFKIQANMDPAHRDRIAFLRICSGKFTRGMKVQHNRLGKTVTLANATIFMAQDRTNVEEAYPGDIIGIHNHGTIKIGDTFTDNGEPLKFTGIPNFAPEHFRQVILKNPLKLKQLQKGLNQLAEEGTIQVFRPVIGNNYILGAVGVLQFDVTMSRFENEYWVDATYEPVRYATARWINCEDKTMQRSFEKKHASDLAYDAEGYLAYLAPSEWELGYVMEQWPKVSFHRTREVA